MRNLDIKQSTCNANGSGPNTLLITFAVNEADPGHEQYVDKDTLAYQAYVDVSFIKKKIRRRSSNRML